MEKRGAERKASRYAAIRLNQTDQERIALILTAGLASSITDALRCGLECAADKAARVLRHQ